MRNLSLIALSILGACGWSNLPDNGNHWISTSLWDANTPIATEDGIYISLPRSGGVALIRSNGTFDRIDIGAGAISKLSLAPDQSTLMGFIERVSCKEDDPRKLKKMKFIQDCPYEKQDVTVSLAAINDGVVQSQTEIPKLFNALEYSNDGAWAIAYVDYAKNVNTNNAGVVDLTSVVVVNLENGETTSLSVGFAADRVLFSDDGSRAVVLSQNSVAVIDLTGETPTKDVTFPLTLDADQKVEPVGVELTPDGRYALISVRGAGDLYVLDLDLHSVNMVSLSSNPSAMAVIADADPFDENYNDRTVVVYENGNMVDVLEHQYFDVESYTLDEPMSGVLSGDQIALLYTDKGGHDAYLLDLDSQDLLEYRLENPPMSMHLAPTEEFAIALTRAENGMNSGVGGLYDQSPGMEILDLTGNKAKSRAYLLEGQGIGLTFSATDTALHALVLQQGVKYLYKLDLYTGAEETLDLSAPPIQIGTMPDGEFFITHESGVGLISFFDPTTGAVREVSGFGVLGLTDSIELIKKEEGQ